MPWVRFAVRLLFFLFIICFGGGFLLPEIPSAQELPSPDSEPLPGEDGNWGEFGSGSGDPGDESTLFSEVEFEAPAVETGTESRFQIGGFVKQEAVYRLKQNDPAWRKLRSVVNLESKIRTGSDWHGKIVVNGFHDFSFALNGRDSFHEEDRRQNESELELRDIYIDGSLWEKVRLKSGRQIASWGQSEFVQITDIVNPRDQTEFARVDLEDARLPVAASRLTVLNGALEINAVAVHEVRPNRIGRQGTDFDPYQTIRAGHTTVADEEIPATALENTEFMGRISWRFNGGDLSFVAGDMFDDEAYLDLTGISFSGGIPKINLTPKHKRIQMAGISGAWVTGSFLWKFEAAAFFNKAIPRNDLASQVTRDPSATSVITFRERDTAALLIGVEYSGINDLLLVAEGTMEQIDDYREDLQPDRTSSAMFLLASYQAMNQILKVRFQSAHLLNASMDNIYKITVSYDLRDALELSAGAIFYQMTDADSPMYPFRKQDRIFAGIKYSF